MDKVGLDTLKTMDEAVWYNRWVFSFVKKHLGKKILEIGAGIGSFTKLLKEVGDVTAVEINRKYISDLRKGYNRDVQIGFGDIDKNIYFFRGRKFDSLVCMNVLEHVYNDENALQNMYSLLKPRGKIILLIPAHRILFSNFDSALGHFRRYSKKEISEKLKKVGFNRISVRYLNWLGAIGWFFLLKITGWRKMPNNSVIFFNFFGRLIIWPEKFIRLPFGLSVLAIAQR